MTKGNPEYPVFYDGKAPDALRTIGEVAKAMGIRQHVLRYWEEQFPMLKPVKRSGGRRYYRPEDITLIAAIDRLVHREGYTLRGARKAIAEGVAGKKAASQAQIAAVAPSIQPAAPEPERAEMDLREILPELRSIREELAAALGAA